MSVRVRAAIFDLGQTLWHYDGVRPAEEVHAIQARAVAPLVERLQLQLDAPVVTVCSEIWERYMAADQQQRDRGSLVEPSLPDIIRATLARYGAAVTPEQSRDWWRVTWILVSDFGVQLYADTLGTLAALHARGICIAINSSRPCTGDMTRQDIDNFGLGPYVGAVVCSGDTGFRKPHSSTFELALSQLGVSAAEAVMVGDDANADIHGAMAIGMTTVWKRNGRRDLPPCEAADYTIDTLSELLELPLFG